MSAKLHNDDARKPAIEVEIRSASHDILNVMTVLCGVQDELAQLTALDPGLAKPLASLEASLQRLQAIANRLNRIRPTDSRARAAE